MALFSRTVSPPTHLKERCPLVSLTLFHLGHTRARQGLWLPASDGIIPFFCSQSRGVTRVAGGVVAAVMLKAWSTRELGADSRCMPSLLRI